MDRTVDDIDRELATRVSRRDELRAERKEIVLQPWTDAETHQARLTRNQQQIDGQSEMIARLVDERLDAQMRDTVIPDDLGELAY